LRSTDGGTSWQPASSGLPRERAKDRVHPGKWITFAVGITALAIDPAHPQTLYAATGWRGVFRSTDSGKSWQPFNTGLADRAVGALALDATGRTLYAGTASGGVVSLRRSP
jgi:isoaspartyl peptidase/L-asparaginase-like protein (Ntn-hydrolase superfamily)